MIPYGKQSISQKDIDAVVNVLNSDFLTDGPQVPIFEKSISDYCQSQFAVASNSATSALHLACLALDLNANGLVWTSPISFVASSNCALYCGAAIDFVDIDPVTYNMSVQLLEDKLHHARTTGKQLPDIIVAVHLSGQVCDMEKISQLSKEFDFSIIEDASHAIGSQYKNQPTGSCKYSDITIFSFHPVKIITSAEGGMATTNQEALYTKMKLLRSHGINKDESQMTEDSHGDWYYQQIALGYNYRMSDLHAVLGTSQMQRLDEIIVRRKAIAHHYNEELFGLPLQLPQKIQASCSSWHLFIIRLKLIDITKSHKTIFRELREQQIGVNLHYIPIHLQPFYKKLGFKSGMFPNSEDYYKEAISIPLFPQMSHSQQETVIGTLKKVLI